MNREEKMAAAKRMREAGSTYSAIVQALGVPHGTVYRWCNPDHAEALRVRSRAWKERHRGRCVDCGARTWQGSERCATCSAEKRHAERRWTKAAITDAMHRFAARHGRQPSASDFLSGAGVRDEHRQRFYADGDYPSGTTVQKEFGSWAAAVRAAGFPPARVGRPPKRLAA